jgi:alpha-glucoside transport system substrate-binding protein
MFNPVYSNCLEEKMKTMIWRVALLVVAVAMFLSACGPAATEVPAEPAAPVASGTFLERAFAGEFKGTVVTMAGPFVDSDAVKFEQSVKSFEDQTGIDIQYSGSKEFEASISISIDGGNPPDIADFPQPGLLETQVKKGKVVDLNTFLDLGKLQANYNQSWLDMATMEGPNGPIMAGVWGRVNGKSLVWYPKKAFDEAGYTVPQTWDELIALSDQIVADGDAPWCIGIESGAATGWAATDWMEEFMLRTTSLENYDKWVKGELKFDSPEVRKAAEAMSDLWFKEGYAYGGRQAIVTTSFGDSPKPMFENPPKCWMHKQGNFITSFFPEGLEAGVDYDFFYLPGIDPAYGKPVLVAGDIYAMFNDRPEVRAVMEYFTTGASVEGWVRAGGAISPHKDSSLDWYTNTVDRGVAEIILNASSVRFDASDLMPGAVGSGSFWKSMTSYVSESIDLDTALKEIDASWP